MSSSGEAFGKPIAEFQGVSFPLAEAETQYQAARWLCLRTLWLKDQGSRTPLKRRCANGGVRSCPAKSSSSACCHTGMAATAATIRSASGYRDVFGLQIGDGTAQIMKMIIARQMTSRLEG